MDMGDFPGFEGIVLSIILRLDPNKRSRDTPFPPNVASLCPTRLEDGTIKKIGVAFQCIMIRGTVWLVYN